MNVCQRVSELQTQTVGPMLGWSHFTKGHNSIRTAQKRYLISTQGLMMLYICTKFQENISKGFSY